jgi:hypothetical protein
MKVLEVRHVEDCLDGSYIREFALDTPTDRGFIHYLGASGRLCYYADFARPFFTVLDDRRFKLKGVEGERDLTIVVFADGATDLLAWLTDIVGRYRSGL